MGRESEFIVRDTTTQSRFLPEALRQTSNSGEYILLKLALEQSLETTLTDYERQLVTSYFIEEKTYKQLALEHGCSVSSISRHIKNAAKKLNKQIDYSLKLYRRYKRYYPYS